MEAYDLIIDSKAKPSPFSMVSGDDFLTHAGGSVDPHAILREPTLSLYCLDHARQRALFVDTPPDSDLLQAPFYFIAQYETARRLIAVPYDTLHALAREVELDPRCIILIFSTGRCGSTLFSQVLNLNPQIVSFSEPDVFTQLVMLRTAGQGSDAQIESLLHDSLMIMCANARQQGFQRYAFKFRSYVLSLSDLLYHAVPEAKLVFLYRHARTWAFSFSRAFGSTDDKVEEQLVKSRYIIPSIDAYLKTHTGSISWTQYLAHMWVSTMRDSRWLQQHGAALACARFEDLQATPQAVLLSLLNHCGLPMPDPDQLASALAKDSQAGTAGAQDRKAPARILTDAGLTELERIVCQLDPELSSDTILPNTSLPSAK